MRCGLGVTRQVAVGLFLVARGGSTAAAKLCHDREKEDKPFYCCRGLRRREDNEDGGPKVFKGR